MLPMLKPTVGVAATARVTRSHAMPPTMCLSGLMVCVYVLALVRRRSAPRGVHGTKPGVWWRARGAKSNRAALKVADGRQWEAS